MRGGRVASGMPSEHLHYASLGNAREIEPYEPFRCYGWPVAKTHYAIPEIISSLLMQ